MTRTITVTSFHRGLAVAAALLAVTVSRAQAVPVTFDVNYVTTSGQNCLGAFCFPSTPGTTFQKSFMLDSSQLTGSGSYDVTSSLSPPFTLPPGVTSSTTDYHAIVTAGIVTDLAIDFSYNGSTNNPITGEDDFSSSFQASGGSFSTSDSNVNFGLENTSSDNSAGTYTISRVVPTPEPATALLFVAGLLGLGAARGRARGRAAGSRAG